MNLVQVQKLFKNEIQCKAYLDEVPKNAKYPAISYRHQARSAARLLSGSESGRSDTWVVTIQTKNDEDVEKLVKQLETLHNFSNDDFQKVFIRMGTTATKSADETIRTTTATMQTFLRG